ncbi:MAG: hypothetical protein COA78_31545 [Blastopirellula sp.]|nr:MAG: hypothetical protein COA78_31545 [Blastopirellula sp.]
MPAKPKPAASSAVPLATTPKMTSRKIRQQCHVDEIGMELLKQSIESFGLSARAHDKIMRVARTIADLEDSTSISSDHISEAINYRLLDRG